MEEGLGGRGGEGGGGEARNYISWMVSIFRWQANTPFMTVPVLADTDTGLKLSLNLG